MSEFQFVDEEQDPFPPAKSEEEIMEELMREQRVQATQHPQQQYAQPQYAQQMQYAPQQPMSEIELRLQKSQYYRLVLNEWLFADDYSEPAVEVMNELRNFITERLNVLLGLAPENQALQFTDQEVMALKRLAGTALQKFGAMVQSQPQRQQPQAPKAAPKLSKVATPMPQLGGAPKKALGAVQGAPRNQMMHQPMYQPMPQQMPQQQMYLGQNQMAGPQYQMQPYQQMYSNGQMAPQQPYMQAPVQYQQPPQQQYYPVQNQMMVPQNPNPRPAQKIEPIPFPALEDMNSATKSLANKQLKAGGVGASSQIASATLEQLGFK